MVRNVLKTVLLSLLLVCSAACDQGATADESSEGEPTAPESTEGATETPAPTAELALEWLTIGELPVQANVPVGSTVTSIGSMWSVRTPTNCEFRVTPPPDTEFMAGRRTLENEMSSAERGSSGALQEVLLNEPGETEWLLGYTRENAMSPGENRWVLQSLRAIGDAGYTCSSISASAAIYECALEACRGLRAAQ